MLARGFGSGMTALGPRSETRDFVFPASPRDSTFLVMSAQTARACCRFDLFYWPMLFVKPSKPSILGSPFAALSSRRRSSEPVNHHKESLPFGSLGSWQSPDGSDCLVYDKTIQLRVVARRCGLPRLLYYRFFKPLLYGFVHSWSEISRSTFLRRHGPPTAFLDNAAVSYL